MFIIRSQEPKRLEALLKFHNKEYVIDETYRGTPAVYFRYDFPPCEKVIGGYDKLKTYLKSNV